MVSIDRLTSKFNEVKQTIELARFDWKKGVLNKRFLDLFNITFQCKDQCSFGPVVTEDCR